MTHSGYDVVVVGSANLDLAVQVERAPRTGETVLGGDLVEGPGGKGLNQAVGCARLGLRTAFVGAVGDDDAGRLLRQVLEAEQVAPMLVTSDRGTGRAVVLTDRDGDSTITVSAGANADLDAEAVDDHGEAIRGARAVLAQHEIPDAAIRRAAGLAEGLFVLNPAPGRAVPPEVLDRVDVLVPNGHELAVLAGLDTPPRDVAAVAEIVAGLGIAGCVVVTLGARGAVVIERDGTATGVPANVVDVVDATAAGDTFCAALTQGLLAGSTPVEAARWANRAAALTTTRPGAAGSMPRLDELL